ncbi:DEAD/DEAH box helicase [Bdellovibrio reynosensis]|uniref:DEAD/DEAH box helicase n=1 Tax=Bdellovibrio reynosensis TaxID=2835041 RepID=A0ABY4C870_9BACT|nr:DEAD/DEAH box helicase [Bdellovibrio reynosensis]UOF00107.1 DEAD/DEAH box helicase [Bdellovibrio reynosensis]
MKFEKFHLSEDLVRNLNDNGFFRTTDIQYKAIPSIMKGEDVLAIAQTGTGKTAAFAIPIINEIHSNKSSKRSLGIKCLVMVPTRELAQQIGEVFNRLSKHTKVKPFAVFGGVEQDAQIKKLEDGIDILIATPGRMFDLISQGFIDISHIETLVLDEADHMLDLGFIEDIESIKRKITRRHQTLFFSATINPEIKKLAFSQVRSNAIRIQVSPEDPVSKNVAHFVMFVEMDDKRFFLAEYLKQNEEGKFIIFVRTRVRAERVAKALERAEIQSLTIHGGNDQADRAEVMKAFRNGDCKVLIATDVSARGIDIPDVTHVINYDLPEKPENYVHRIGRTGRGFNKGIAVSFCSQEEKPLLEDVETLLTKKIEEIKVSKNSYQAIVAQPDLGLSLQEMVLAEEARFSKGKKKK